MKATQNNTAIAAGSEKVDEYLAKVKPPLLDVMQQVRKIILAAGDEISEEIKWNSPAFFYTGEIKPFNPKEYKRHIVVFNVAKNNSLRLIFISGAKINDATGLLEGDYNDGRCIAQLNSTDEVKEKEHNLTAAIQKWLALVEK